MCHFPRCLVNNKQKCVFGTSECFEKFIHYSRTVVAVKTKLGKRAVICINFYLVPTGNLSSVIYRIIEGEKSYLRDERMVSDR